MKTKGKPDVSLEEAARVVRLRTNIQHVLLRTIATAGVLSIAALAPNALQVLKMFDRGKARVMHPKYLFAPAFDKLLAKEMIMIEKSKQGKCVRLTEFGEQTLARMMARSSDTRKHQRWDKRWRLVIYDIRERKRAIRVHLQTLLRSFGFCRLQHSVWIYPYDSEEFVLLLKANFQLGKEVLYLIVEKVENDGWIKDQFGLK